MPAATKPRYRLALPRFIPVTDTRTLKFKRRGRRAGRTRRVLVQFRDWDKSVVRFGNVRKEGRGAQRKIRLLKAPGLDARNIGGIPIPRSILTDRSKFPSTAAIPDRARDKAVAAMALAVNKALARRR